MRALVSESSELVSGLTLFRAASEDIFIYLFIYLFILSKRVLAGVAVAGCVGWTDNS